MGPGIIQPFLLDNVNVQLEMCTFWFEQIMESDQTYYE